MNKNELIEALKSIIENAETYIDGDYENYKGSPWMHDIECSKVCIELVNKFCNYDGSIVER